jgi:tRNA/rRNA methyltransferase
LRICLRNVGAAAQPRATAQPARSAAAEILARADDGEVALLFGNETAGLSNAEVQRCQRTVFIPANPEYASLNLAAAVQLLCYELRLAAFDSHPPVVSKRCLLPRPGEHQDVQRFFEHLERVMVSSGFLDPLRPRRLLPKLRRLFGRAELERDEINILRGLLDAVERQVAGERGMASGTSNSVDNSGSK